jgi:hypothetical protein
LLIAEPTFSQPSGSRETTPGAPKNLSPSIHTGKGDSPKPVIA